MKKRIIYGLLAFLLVMLETSVLQRIELAGIRPELSLCLIITSSILLGSKFGRRLGLFVGVLQDVLFSPYFGFFTLLCFWIGEGAGLLHEGVDSDNLLYTLGIGTLSVLVYSLIAYLFTDFMKGRIQIGEIFIHKILAELVYTLPFLILIYLLVRLLNHGIDLWDEKTIERREKSRTPILWRK